MRNMSAPYLLVTIPELSSSRSLACDGPLSSRVEVKDNRIIR
jgi:hypothetical protein